MCAVTFAGLFGWLHQPNDPNTNIGIGVVIVSPIGRDARCAHAPMRLLADQLAAGGFPTLRYDHRGEGDSLPLPDGDDVDAVQVWLKDIEEAIALLRSTTGVGRVILVGVRLGATLAYQKAEHCDGLVLLAPVLSGRSWLRQIQFSMQAGRNPDGEATTAVDADGILMNVASATSLSTLSLPGPSAPNVPVLVAAQNKLITNFGASISRNGATATVGDFPGFDELFMDAHSNLAPHLVFDRVPKWLSATFGAVAEPPTGGKPPACLSELAPAFGAADFLERPVVFGDNLQGMLCTPQGAPMRSRGVIFCNTGGDPRSGIGGFATASARHLAGVGVKSLRFDFSGLGDSPAQAPHERTHIYETSRRRDLLSAVDLLKSDGVSEIYLVGICSGAYHALRSAEIGAVAGIFAVSPAKLTWGPGDTLSFGRKDQGRATYAYKSAAMSREAWSRLLRGQIDVETVLRTLAVRTLRRWTSMWERSDPNSPRSILQKFLARGGRVKFLMGLDDSSLDEVNAHFGVDGVRMRERGELSIFVEPSLDHGLARSASRAFALRALLDWM